MPDLFRDYIKSVLETKHNHMETQEDEKAYVPFVVNRALSYHMDTVLLANEMNKLPNTDKKLQYDFLINIVRSRKRPYQKWTKYIAPDDIEVVKEYYGYSNEKATAALQLLSPDQLEKIKKIKGGR